MPDRRCVVPDRRPRAGGTSGPRFRLEAGQLLCIDNYRMLHGREAYVDTERKVVSIWAWTTGAVKIPAGQLDIVTPYVPEPAR